MQHESNTSTVATTFGELSAGDTAACQLVIFEGPDMGRAIDLDQTERVVGSAAECDLVLSDERVSRRHFSIARIDDGYLVRDLDSRNGTLYAGSAVSEVTLAPGSTLKVGRSFVRIQPRPQPLEVMPSQQRRFGELVAESLAMREVFAVLELAAQSAVTVLLEGETGTGKELAARAVHEMSERRKGPFVAVDCGALPESLLESELFGHVRGAFTGAAKDRKGAFLRARGGTIFLDELDSISATAQARLLRVLEERKVRAVGADAEQAIDVRVIGASQKALATAVAEGSLRPDLFYRLSVLNVRIPPLRDRREDIPLIVREMLRQRGMVADEPSRSRPREEALAGGQSRSRPRGKVLAGGLCQQSLQRLMAHDWPGNVRELRNVVERSLALSPTAQQMGELRLSVQPVRGAGEPLLVRSDLEFSEAKRLVLESFEKRYLQDLMARCEGNISSVSREANVDRKHLRTLLRRHGLID
jgi:transcriptional regulator with PAS, ATPase and Fis domain